MDKFTFYKEYYELLAGLPAEDFKGVFSAICSYMLYGEAIADLTETQKVIYKLLLPSLDKSISRSRAGKTRGETKKEEEIKPTEEKPEKRKVVRKEAFSDNDILNEAFKDFYEMRIRIKHPMTPRAVVMLKTKLKSLSENPITQAKILDQSTFKSWQGVFKLSSDFVPMRDYGDKKEPKAEPPAEELSGDDWWDSLDRSE
jgi:hypothetical protein